MTIEGLRMPDIDHLKAYICVHVTRAGLPILLVSREDGEWVFLCGDRVHDNEDEIDVIGLNHVFAMDASLLELLPMVDNEVAKRSADDGVWDRSIALFGDED